MNNVITAVCLCFAALTAGLTAEGRPVWKDADQTGGTVKALSDGSKVRVDLVQPEMFRVRRTKGGVWTESGMNRYGLIARAVEPGEPKVEFSIGVDGSVSFRSLVSSAAMTISTALTEKGGRASFPLSKEERLYGLGDVDRRNLQRRGNRYEIFVKNINSYIPVPMVIAKGGWGVFLNTTWKNYFDIGSADPDRMLCEVPEGDLDFYVFVGRDYRALLDSYTRLTGRPQLLPSFAYGFAYVCNQWINDYEYINEATWFQKLGIPCDIMGLEPGWMETQYDHTTKKRWSKDRFQTFPWWCPTGKYTFPAAALRMGINLSLWMCVDYDLFPYEEQCAAGEARKHGAKLEIAEDVSETWVDPRIDSRALAKGVDASKPRPTEVFDWEHEMKLPPNKIDMKYYEEAQYPEGALPWFKHLEKFCDQGARCWKLDGNLQICQIDEHPGKTYRNGMSVEEAHNLYPVVYDKQMARGYEEYTGRRSMVYSAGGYAGVQAYVATWAGDTGGGEKTLVSMLNLGATGHPNQSCDMEIDKPERVHYGFFSPWSQANDWDSFHRPWAMDEETNRRFLFYDKLRYSLFPYIYRFAAEAARTGYPICRSLAFEYPEVAAYDDCHTTYLFGDSLLVSAFSEYTEVPRGVWYDWRKGTRIEGPCRDRWDNDGFWGGGLLVKAGAIIPRWDEAKHLPKGWREDITFDVWPLDSGESSFDWYEDDGDSLDYRAGTGSHTRVTCSVGNGRLRFRIHPREGSFKGMPASHYVKLRVRLDRRPSESFGSYDWYRKMYEVELGDVDAAQGVEYELLIGDGDTRSKALRDRAWVWGEDVGGLELPDLKQEFDDAGFEDLFHPWMPPVKASDREGREIRVMRTVPGFSELMFFKDQLVDDSNARLAEMRTVVRACDLRKDIGPVLGLFDSVVLWPWDDGGPAKLGENFAKYRELSPRTKTLLGICLWDFKGQKPLDADSVRGQLAFALGKFKSGEIQGVVFHGSPLLAKAPDVLDLCREWLNAHGTETCTK